MQYCINKQHNNKNSSINCYDVLFKLILLLPITTLLQKYFNIINQLLAATTIILIFILLCKSKFKLKSALLLMLIFLNHIYAICVTNFVNINNTNTLYYYMYTVLFYILIIDKSDKFIFYLKKNSIYIKNIILSWSVLVIISLFFRSSYDGRYFSSFTGNGFRFAPTCLFILALILFLYVETMKKKTLLMIIVPLGGLFLQESRTYFFIGILVFLVFWYIYLNKPSKFYLSLVAIVPIGILLAMNLSIFDKFIDTSTAREYQSMMSVFTNGRVDFWRRMINAYKISPLNNQILGNGFSYIYTIGEIWAHNDFIQLLLTFGIVGVATYLMVIIRILKTFIFDKKGMIPSVIIIIIFMIWFFNAMFNMFYTYFCSMISFPILLVSIKLYYSKKSMCNKKY